MLSASPQELCDLSDELSELSADVLFVAVGAPITDRCEQAIRQRMGLVGKWLLDCSGQAGLLPVAAAEEILAALYSQLHITEAIHAGA